jgi:hypothetical protein
MLYGEHGKTSSLIFCIAAEVANILWCLALYVKAALDFPFMKASDLLLQIWSSRNSRRGVSGHSACTPGVRSCCIPEKF